MKEINCKKFSDIIKISNPVYKYMNIYGTWGELPWRHLQYFITFLQFIHSQIDDIMYIIIVMIICSTTTENKF